MLKQYLEVGKIVGTHGLKGDLRVDIWCDTLEFFCSFNTLYFDNGKKSVSVKSKPHKRIALVKIKGIDTVEQADELRGKILYINRDDAQLEEEEYFIQDIIGLSVINEETKEKYGLVTDVFKTGANDVYEIKDSENKTFLIPVIDDVVIKTDVLGGVVLIKPMKGLFDDED